MKSLLITWLATTLALATLTLLPNVSVISPLTIIISATLLWLVLSLLWPVLKIFLLPFNLATFGLIGSLVYLFLFWFCLWIFPGITIQPVRVFGFYLGDMLVLLLAASILSGLQRGYSWLLQQFFSKKRRK